MTRCRAWAVTAVAVLVAASACSDDGVSDVTGSTATTTTSGPPAIETVAGSAAPRVVDGACPEGVPPLRRISCGWLVVPQDRTAERTITVRIPFARVAPDGTADPGPPVVFLAGGPGESGLDSVGAFLDDAPVGARPVILFDQRGTGAALPSLDCPEVADATVGTFGTVAEGEESVVALAFASCATRLDAEVPGLDRSAYSTAAAAADVADLAGALGLEEVDLYGVSYGTALAQVVAAEHPERVRAVVLDSVYPVSVPHGPLQIAENAHLGIDAFDRACQAAPACTAVLPDVPGTIAAIAARFDATPYQATLTDPVTGDPVQVRLTGADVVAGIVRAMYSPSLLAVLPQSLAALAGGDVTGIDAVAGQGVFALGRLSEGVAASVECTDRYRGASEDDLESVRLDDPSMLTLAGIGELATRCAQWGVFGEGPPDEPLAIAAPTLMLSGAFDPVTPPAVYPPVVAAGLQAGFSAVVTDGGHAVTLNTVCGPELAQAFLAEPGAEPGPCGAATASPWADE